VFEPTEYRLWIYKYTPCHNFRLLGTQASAICYNSTNVYHKMQLQRTHRNYSIPWFRRTKYAIMLLKTCQITSMNVKQAEKSLKSTKTFFTANTTKKSQKHGKLPHDTHAKQHFSCQTTSKASRFLTFGTKCQPGNPEVARLALTV